MDVVEYSKARVQQSPQASVIVGAAGVASAASAAAVSGTPAAGGTANGAGESATMADGTLRIVVPADLVGPLTDDLDEVYAVGTQGLKVTIIAGLDKLLAARLQTILNSVAMRRF